MHFHIPSSNSSIVTTIKAENKQGYLVVSMLLFYSLKNLLTKVAYFSKTYYYTKFCDPMLLRGASVAATS